MAVLAAHRYAQQGPPHRGGRRPVEVLRPGVNHDILIDRLKPRSERHRSHPAGSGVSECGHYGCGVVIERHEGTPQGGPLSPLLANVLLTRWIGKLERRGHCFARYADDCNVYVRSQKAA
nr:reverse transcriptase domain-containing protein [Marinobacter sp. Arc7-DN-1]